MHRATKPQGSVHRSAGVALELRTLTDAELGAALGARDVQSGMATGRRTWAPLRVESSSPQK